METEIQAEHEASPKKKNRKRLLYVDCAPLEILDSAQRLTALPTSYDPNIHLEPRRKHFATERLYVEFKVSIEERNVETASARLAGYKRTLEAMETLGEDQQELLVATRSANERLKNLKSQLVSKGLPAATIDQLLVEARS